MHADEPDSPAYGQEVSAIDMLILCRHFRLVCQLILQRLREIPRQHLLHIWHKVTLELYKYLYLKRL